MVMSNPATVDDLVDRGYVIPDGSPVAQTRIDAAWRALQRELRKNGTSVEAVIATGWATIEDLADIVADAAMRVLSNPDGVTQEQQSIDDYSESRTLANSTMDMYFTSAEIAGLLPPIPTAGSMRYT